MKGLSCSATCPKARTLIRRAKSDYELAGEGAHGHSREIQTKREGLLNSEFPVASRKERVIVLLQARE